MNRGVNTMIMTPAPRQILLLVAANIGLAESFAQSSSSSSAMMNNGLTTLFKKTTTASSSCSRRRRTTTTTTTTTTSTSSALRVVPPRPRNSNWEDDTKSSRTNAGVTDFVPPWRDHQRSGVPRSSGSQAIPKKEMPLPSYARSAPPPPPPRGGGGNDDASTTPSGEGATASPGPRSAPAPRPDPNLGGGGSSGGTTTMLLRNIRWPLIRDPPGSSPDYPLPYARIMVTILSTVSTWHLHAQVGHSPALASSAVALLVSTCLDRRLGSAAMCGSFAGMSGGHLVPNVAIAASLGALTSLSYEVLVVRAKNLCRGIGGRLGAAAFLAASVAAGYRNVGIVSRRARRGLRRGVVGGAGAAGGPWYGILGDPVLASMILHHVLGAVATILLREYSDDSAAADPVRASSVVDLLGSLFLRDPTAVLALYGGSFVGMSPD